MKGITGVGADCTRPRVFWPPETDVRTANTEEAGRRIPDTGWDAEREGAKIPPETQRMHLS